MSVALKGKLAHGLLVGALLAIGGWASAAETEAPDDGAAAQADEAAEENAAADDGQPESHGVFLPTEEISEDFAVPFPVDI